MCNYQQCHPYPTHSAAVQLLKLLIPLCTGHTTLLGIGSLLSAFGNWRSKFCTTLRVSLQLAENKFSSPPGVRQCCAARQVNFDYSNYEGPSRLRLRCRRLSLPHQR
jgi:hypothetical protein